MTKPAGAVRSTNPGNAHARAGRKFVGGAGCRSARSTGDHFADNYQLVSLEGTCGTFLLGDSRFRLCEGEEVLK